MKTFPKPQAISDLEAKRVKVQLELQDVDAEIGAICSHLADETPRLSKLQAEAVKLVDGEETRHVVEADTRRELNELYHRQQVLHEALGQIDKRLQPLTSEHNKAACLQVRPECIKIGGRLLSAVKELCNASAEEKGFYEELRDAGVDSITSYLPRLVFHGDWKWDDPNGGGIYYWRKYLAENYPELKGGAK